MNANNASGFTDLHQVTSTGSIEIQDMTFCSHGKERCSSCQMDFREDNSFVAGLDMIEEREGLSVETTFNKVSGFVWWKIRGTLRLKEFY